MRAVMSQGRSPPAESPALGVERERQVTRASQRPSRPARSEPETALEPPHVKARELSA
jgi:hypothetical protein